MPLLSLPTNCRVVDLERGIGRDRFFCSPAKLRRAPDIETSLSIAVTTAAVAAADAAAAEAEAAAAFAACRAAFVDFMGMLETPSGTSVLLCSLVYAYKSHSHATVDNV